MFRDSVFRDSVRLRPVRPAGWWFDVALVAGFALFTWALTATAPLLDLDVAIRDWCDDHRPTAAYVTARVLNYLGQGGSLLTPLALLSAGFIGWKRHSIRPFLPVIAAFVLTYLTIGPLKIVTERPAGTSDLPPDLFQTGMSYPSGHVVNALVWYAVLAILWAGWLSPAQRLALRVVPPIIVIGTTTYLSYHWLSDGVAAVLLGLALERLLRRVPWDELPLGKALEARGWAAPAGI